MKYPMLDEEINPQFTSEEEANAEMARRRVDADIRAERARDPYADTSALDRELNKWTDEVRDLRRKSGQEGVVMAENISGMPTSELGARIRGLEQYRKEDVSKKSPFQSLKLDEMTKQMQSIRPSSKMGKGQAERKKQEIYQQGALAIGDQQIKEEAKKMNDYRSLVSNMMSNAASVSFAQDAMSFAQQNPSVHQGLFNKIFGG